VLQLRIPLPPIEEQKRIVSILDKADGIRRKRGEAESLTDKLGQAVFCSQFRDVITCEPVSTLGNCVQEFRYGTSVKSAQTGKPTLRIPNVVGGRIDLHDLKCVPVDHAEHERLRLQIGDMLFVRTNGNPDYVGRCAVFTEEAVTGSGFEASDFIYASYLIRARLRPSALDPVFLQFYLSAPQGRKSLRDRCRTSAGQYNINTEGLGAIPVPVPSIERQRRFAAIVSDILKAKAKHTESLRQLDDLFNALAQRGFRGEL
jgi:type I restriction enzyme S subunit